MVLTINRIGYQPYVKSDMRIRFGTLKRLICAVYGLLLCRELNGVVATPAPSFNSGLASVPSSSSSAESELISRMVVPSYLKLFSDVFFKQDINSTSESPAPHWEKLFRGIDNGNCKAHVLELLRRSADQEQLSREDSAWVLHMMDSWGKTPEGILSGHVNAYGDFDECIRVQAKNVQTQTDLSAGRPLQNFEGMYCTVYFSKYWDVMKKTRVPVAPAEGTSTTKFALERYMLNGIEGKDLYGFSSFGIKIAASVGLCLPNSCSKDDTQQLLVNALQILYASGSVTFAEGSELSLTDLPWPFTLSCYEEKREGFGVWTVLFSVGLAVIAGICLVTGVIEWRLNQGVGEQKMRGPLYNYVMAFSVYRNGKAWINTEGLSGDIRCLSGLRFLSMAWIIFGHSYFALTFSPQWDMVDVLEQCKNLLALTALSANFSVDSFFVISGLLVSYNLMKALEILEGRVNIGMLYLKRYLRLTPTYGIMIGMTTMIVPYLGRGPYWAVMDRWSEACQANWWTNLLYLNNFVNSNFLCQGESWYLANDMQFFILSPFLIYPLWKWELVGKLLVSICTIVSCVTPMLLVHFLDIEPIIITTRPRIGEHFQNVSIRPYARISPYLVGIWLGWILFKCNGRQVSLSRWTVFTLWSLSALVAPTLLFITHPWFEPKNEIGMVDGLAYAGLSRLAWGCVVAWVIFACEKGYGGILNTFLSWNLFRPLGRLTFCVYLSSFRVQMILHLRLKQTLSYDPYLMINLFFAHLVMSFMIGFFLWLFFEAPFLALQRQFLAVGPIKESTTEPDNAKIP